MISFMSALSVDILAFFMTETEGPTQVTKTNLQRLLISSPVWKKIKIKNQDRVNRSTVAQMAAR